jgi:O-antigen ligase
MCGTSTLSRPVYHRSKGGVGGRDPLAGHTLDLTVYAARGRVERLVRLALLGCAELSRSAPLGSQFGISLSRRSLSSPIAILLYRNNRPDRMNIGYVFPMIYSLKLLIFSGVTIVRLVHLSIMGEHFCLKSVTRKR